MLSVPFCTAALSSPLVSWAGSTSEWNRKLGVGEIRLGCSGPASQCLKSLDAEARRSGIDRVTLAIGPDPDTVAARALELAAAAASDPRLVGVGLDDFLSVLLKWQKQGYGGARAAQLLSAVSANVKAKKSTMQFGITLYTDQLASRLLGDGYLPPAVREGVDRVSLYVHYREDGPSFAEAVPQVRKLFPRATVLGGVYPYDRIDYLPCGRKNGSLCEASREVELFEQQLRVQVQLLKDERIDGIELYPGIAGREALWPGWSDPKVCRAGRRDQCIDTSRQMRDSMLSILREALPAAAASGAATH